ncbi:hypothetical protein GOV07_00545 [Candidatus Woesearchaeota archaeon]|nr:hypothetical protein [Candidatus Woesearchaeota archaeon]
MPELKAHTVRGCPLVCPDCHGRAFSKTQELLESKWLFFSKKEGVNHYNCDVCGFSYIIK